MSWQYMSVTLKNSFLMNKYHIWLYITRLLIAQTKKIFSSIVRILFNQLKVGGVPKKGYLCKKKDLQFVT
jgi:hypothetical protein